jgi:hypothetical protein
MLFSRVVPVLLPILLAAYSQAHAQTAPAEALTSASVAGAQKQYNASFSNHPQLINGPEYLDYAKRYHAQIGHQFFAVATQQPGSVFYNDHYFTDLRLAYDLVRDQVVLSVPGSPLTLRLANEYVKYFTINHNRFVRLVADSASAAVIRTGYYEQLLDGPVQVLAKRTKRTKEQIVQGNLDLEFIAKDQLLMKKAGTYYPISSKGAAMRVLADRAPEMQAYLKSEKLSFKKNQLEASLVQLARHYTELPAR